MATAPLTRATKRDVTKALDLAVGAKKNSGNSDSQREQYLDEAIDILTKLDARTGRRDPSVRKPKKRSAKKAKKSARKARR